MSDSTQIIPNEPSGIAALRQAVDFVARGIPLSQQMVGVLSRMLTEGQERLDLVQTVMLHAQIGRLLTMAQGMQLVENQVFNTIRLKSFTNKELLELMKICQAETHNITDYLADRAPKLLETSEGGVKDAADPSKIKARSEANERVAGTPPSSRRRVTSFLERLRLADVTDIKVTPVTSEPTTQPPPTPPPV